MHHAFHFRCHLTYKDGHTGILYVVDTESGGVYSSRVRVARLISRNFPEVSDLQLVQLAPALLGEGCYMSPGLV